MSFQRFGAVLSLSLLLFCGVTTAHAQETATGDVLDSASVDASVDSSVDAGDNTISPDNLTPGAGKKFDANFFYARVEDVRETVETIPETDPIYIPQFGPDQKRIKQEVAVKYLDGPLAGQQAQLQNVYQNQPRDIRVNKGDKVIIQQNTTDGQVVDTMIVDFSRTTQSWLFIAFFALAVLIYGGRQGVSSLLGFVATFGILFLVFIPGIISGMNPVFLAIACGVVITFLVHFFVGGFSAKSISSTIGTAGGTIVAGLLAMFATHVAHLTGLSSEDARNLFVAIPTYDYNGIFLASIIIGSLGAVMDVGISIGSAVREVKDASTNPNFWQMYKAGVTVGKDILGTMSNTLILAYIGTGLPLILLLHSYNNIGMAMDYDFIVDEIVRSIAGSLGLLTAIPITAYFSALIEHRNIQKAKKKNDTVTA